MPVNLLYVAPDSTSLRMLIDPDLNVNNLSTKDVDFIFATRLLGGFVTSTAWVDKACAAASSRQTFVVPRCRRITTHF